VQSESFLLQVRDCLPGRENGHRISFSGVEERARLSSVPIFQHLYLRRAGSQTAGRAVAVMQPADLPWRYDLSPFRRLKGSWLGRVLPPGEMRS